VNGSPGATVLAAETIWPEYRSGESFRFIGRPAAVPGEIRACMIALLVAERRRRPGGAVPPDAVPPDAVPPAATLQQFVRARDRVRPRERPVPVQERPPAVTVRGTALPARLGAGP
jgi:hypothetical protein